MSLPIMSAPLSAALTERGYSDLTDVQSAVLEDKAAGRDLLVSAQTGSGKTVAYGIAMAPTLLGDAERFDEAGDPMALIVAPTRELAMQVTNELTWLYAKAGAKLATLVGGMDPRAERRRLAQGVHIVVGTPGRLRDHLTRGALQIGALKVLVLDEADEMLNLGFREDLEFLLQATPASRRTLLFSATLPRPIVQMTKRYQQDGHRIEIAKGTSGHVDIEYRAVRIAPNEVEHAVTNVLRQAETPSAIVFCNTRETVRHLSSALAERGFSAVTLSGELGQSERNQAIQALRDGRARVCVATDVAARGLDLPSLGLVIHADLPSDAETLQHRSGRTGRAGRKGVSVLLVPISRRRKAERLLAEARITATWGAAPSADEIRKADEARLLADPIFSEEPTEDDAATAARLLEAHSPEVLAATLVRQWRARLPSPEDVFDPNFGRDAKAAHQGGREGREERGPKKHDRDGPSTWFRMDVGRKNNADPKWILPLLCRRGKITRQEIGSIKIFDRETKFEIADSVAKRFAKEAEVSEGDDITITLADGAPTGGGDRAGPRDGKPGGKPKFNKPEHGAGGPSRHKPRRPKAKPGRD
ncbi:DEAD/DEAH box helicase [Fulvimarina sp. 2208YS6-2-32]|uniref:DEAD/DEAH box helicase n=1 Tax=Fulvimarina uroteuthidis TaxID=3098149 RepID=A0ABU5HZF3_9HYPH|nr:DEAD/DEAH box helicase [Fulvimarina sp. 2208YS6-2-32]MDY8108341.1 DEAD/DEAH box helicase [Fulvimarina sp. 2208YS6-2-32]